MKKTFKLLLVLLLMGFPAQAQEDDIQTIISGQLTAFQADDMDAAFSFASKQIKSIFQNSATFGRMVKNGYPMVYRPKSFEFQKLHEVEGHYFQQVQIEDQDGVFYVIQYAMINSDLGWKIDGVQLFKTNITAI